MINEPLNYIDSPEFHANDADERILTPTGACTTENESPLPGKRSARLLTKEQETHCFRQMNYLKFKAARLRNFEWTNPATTAASAAVADEFRQLLSQATNVRNLLIRRNMGLVVSMARKRHASFSVPFGELVSDGTASLIQAIERFDFSRGFRFSTYAANAILQNFRTSHLAERKRAERFRTVVDGFSGEWPDRRCLRNDEQLNRQQCEAIKDLLSRLPGQDREIIVARFGLGNGVTAESLSVIGDRLGMSGERVRQIEFRAICRLRRLVENVDIPGF